MSKESVNLWLDFSRWRMHSFYESKLPSPAKSIIINEMPPEVRSLVGVIQHWILFSEKRTAEPDVLFELCQLRVLADMFVSRPQREEIFAQARKTLVETLDAWWEQFKQDNDKHA